MKCFSHTTASFTNPRTGANIDQYVRQRCAATTVVQTTVAGGTPTGTVTTSVLGFVTAIVLVVFDAVD